MTYAPMGHKSKTGICQPQSVYSTDKKSTGTISDKSFLSIVQFFIFFISIQQFPSFEKIKE